jgi:calcineurin-like phosphoesterase family protein
LKDPPVPIDYVVVLGDQPPSQRAEDYNNITRELDGQMQLVAGNHHDSFFRIYRRNGAR